MLREQYNHFEIFKMFELLYRDTLIGYVKNYAPDDGAWFVGDVELSPAGASMRHFFAHLIDESDSVVFTGPNDWMEDSNWFLRDVESATLKGISLPAVYIEDGNIYWRWKD